MSGKTIVTQPGTTLTASPKRLLVLVVSVLAVSAAIVFGSMASNDSAAVGQGVDPRLDYAFRHPSATYVAPASPSEQTSDYLTRYLANHVPVSDSTELHNSPDYGIRHMADWKLLGFLTSVD